MRLVSYLIIALISLIIGINSFNSINLINQKDIIFFQYSLPNMKDRYLLEPIINLIAADLAS